MARRGLIAGGVVAATAVGATIWAAPMAADPEGFKDCSGLDERNPATSDAAQTVAQEPEWSQRFGTINDMSCLNRTAVRGVVRPTSEAQLVQAVNWARDK